MESSGGRYKAEGDPADAITPEQIATAWQVALQDALREKSKARGLEKLSPEDASKIASLATRMGSEIDKKTGREGAFLKQIISIGQAFISAEAAKPKGVMGKVKGFFGMKEQAALKEMIRATIIAESRRNRRR